MAPSKQNTTSPSASKQNTASPSASKANEASTSANDQTNANSQTTPSISVEIPRSPPRRAPSWDPSLPSPKNRCVATGCTNRRLPTYLSCYQCNLEWYNAK